MTVADFDQGVVDVLLNTAFTADPPEKPTKTIAEVIDDIWQNRDRAHNGRCLVKRMQRIDKEMSGQARAQFANSLALRQVVPRSRIV
jgi:type I restriction enzyme R subunit